MIQSDYKLQYFIKTIMSYSRVMQTLTSQIPDGDVFASMNKSFHSFWRIQKTCPSLSRHSTDQNIKLQISQTLDRNKEKLHLLKRQIDKKRTESYDKYIQSNSRYQKLMQMNTMKKRLITTLNKNIGEIKVKSLQQLSGLPLAYQYHSTLLEIKGIKPQPRTGQVCMAFKDNIIVFGGHNSTPLKSIWSLNLKQMVWGKIFPSELVKSGHSILMYKNKYVIVYGGMGFYNSFTHERECQNTLQYFYDITSGIPKTIKALNQEIVEPRKDHAAIIFGHRMIVFGGCSTKKHYLKDLISFDFKSMKWSSIEYQFGSEHTTNYFQHGISQAVFGSYFVNSNSSKLASVSYLDHQGIFVFGGVNGQGEPHKLSQFRLNRRIPILHKIYPQGSPPSYISPSVINYKQDIFMILSGERGFRELFLYEVIKNKYTKIVCGGLCTNLGGINSSLVEHDGSYYILFGITQKGFNSDVIKIELKVRKLSARKRPKANSLYKLSSCIMSNLSQKGSDYI